MKTTTLKFYELDYRSMKAYIAATIFVAGNIVLPQIFHLIPNGGITFLPIYFFTLIAAYKYGWKVGLLTAVLSPLINHLLFDMPPLHLLPAILVKSLLLAATAGMTAKYFRRITIPILLGVVLSYQVTGTFAEWAIEGSLYVAIQDFRIAIPGMLLQIFGGYAVIKYLLKK